MGVWKTRKNNFQSSTHISKHIKGKGENIHQFRIISAIWKAISRLCSAFSRGSQLVR